MTSVHYNMPLLFCSDIQKAKDFYTKNLHQILTHESENYLVFGEKHFAIMAKNKAEKTIYGKNQEIELKDHYKPYELSFETTELDDLYTTLQKNDDITFLHGIKEEAWGQRSFRLKDPDGHPIEILEHLSSTIQRLKNQGLNASKIKQKTGLDQSTIYHYLRTQQLQKK